MKYLFNKITTEPFLAGILAYFLVAILMFFASGCATQKRCNEKFPAAQSSYDSLGMVEKVIVRDTVITIPGATIHDTIPVIIDCDKNGVGTIRPVIKTNASGHVSQTVVAAGNYIIANCKADSLQQVIERQQKEIEHTRSHSIEKTKPVITNEIPGFYNFQNKVAITFELILLLIAGYGFYRIYKV